MERAIETVNQPDVARLADPAQLVAAASLLEKAGRTIESTIVGLSMGRTLPPGTRVRVRGNLSDAPPAGCVIVIAGDRTLVAHRVVGRGWGRRAREYLLTRGDGMLLCDVPTPLDRVIGQVTHCDDGGGWRPVAGPPRAAGPRPWIRALHAHALRLALEIHVAFARVLVRLSFWVAARVGGARLS